MRRSLILTIGKRCARSVLVLLGAGTLTLLFFLVLPLIQAIGQTHVADTELRSVDTANLPPPPPPPPEPEPDEEEQQDEPPELEQEMPQLDLSQMELALNPTGGDGWMKADFTNKLDPTSKGKDTGNGLFSMAELDQKPRAIYQPSPLMTAKVRGKAPGTVYILFVVGKDGRVQQPIVQKASHPVFTGPALAAIKKWKFQPGKRNGKAVRFRMRVPITFPGK